MRATWILALVLGTAVSFAPTEASSQTTSGAPTRRSEQFKTEKEFARHVLEVETLLDKVARKLESGDTVGTEGDALLKEKETLLALDPAMRQRFAEREQQLIAAGLPTVILDRHRATVDNYEKNFQILIDNLTEIDRVRRGQRTDFLDKVKAAQQHLKEHKSQDPPRFLSGNSLPLQSEKKKAPVLDISAATPPPGAEAGLAASLPASPPGPGDLSPTIDVQITQDVIDLATKLGNSPLKIYQHVRDNLAFEPYMGSRKGSRETLLAGSGNDYDLASALIALLRAANIPSRYVAGTVLLSADQAMNWLGVTDAGTAGNLLATAGMEATAYTSGGTIVAISFKHVWVKAYVPYGNYRGVPNDASGKAWIPLDPSFKSYDYPPAANIPAEMGFNADAFIDSYISTFHTLSPVDLYLQQIQTYVAANHPELTYPDDVFRRGTIVPDQLGLLPSSLPYKVLVKDNEYAEIPANKRHQIRFHISDDWGSTLLDQTVNLPEIASKRVTISYVAATPADQATIDAYGDLYSTPPDLIYLKPVLKIDGVAAAVGGGIGAGTLHYSDMYFLTPAGEGNPIPAIYNYITAGTYQGIGIDTFRVAPSVFLPSQNGAVPDTDGLTGDKLYRTAMTYLDRVDRADATAAETMQMVFTTAVSEAIVENVILVWYFFGYPVDWEWRGLIVDADRKIIGPFSLVGDTTKEKQFFVLTGADASISENRVFEDTYNEEAISTIKILELASDMGVPACRIVTSIAADCPGLSQPLHVVSYINEALAQGHKVTIPRSQITYHQWSGTGFIVMDPTTGAAGYIISGGQNGGATVDIWVGPWELIFDTLFRDICSITANITYPAPNDYFPYPGAFAGFFAPQPSHFDVDYTVSYCRDGSRVVSDSFQPHYQYPPGHYTFYAGWGTGATRDFTVFGVHIETPNGKATCKDSGSVTLVAVGDPSLPPGASFQWQITSGPGAGTLSAPTTATTDFAGTTAGEVTVDVAVSNSNGATTASEEATVLEVKVKTVSFSGGHTVYEDNGTRYSAPHWQDNNDDGNATEAGERRFPVAYTRNSKMQVGADFNVVPSGFAGTLMIRGTDLPGKAATISGPTATYPSTQQTAVVSTTIDLLNSKAIAWEFSPDNGTSWCDARTTDHRVYVTLDDPKGSAKLWETVLDIGTRNAKGLSSPAAAVAAVWGDFQGPIPGVTRKPDDGHNVMDGISMNYWLDQSSRTCQRLSAMLADPNGNGSCIAWAQLFRDVLLALGIDGPQAWSLQVDPAKPNETNFMVKRWRFGSHIRSGPDGMCNSDAAGDDVAVVAKGTSVGPDLPCIAPGPDGTLNSTPAGDDTIARGILKHLSPAAPFLINDPMSSWTGCSNPIGDAVNLLGLFGQNNPEPPPTFGNHWITKYGGQFYDPSYGAGPFPTENDHENAAIDGFQVTVPGLTSCAAREQTSSQELVYGVSDIPSGP